MSLFPDFKVNESFLSRILELSHNLTLGDVLKTSQNITYEGLINNEEKVIVRVSRLLEKNSLQRIWAECAFIQALADSGLPCATPVSNGKGDAVVVFDNSDQQRCAAVVFKYATGKPVDYTSFQWLREPHHAENLGRWLAKAHQVAKKFVTENQEQAKHFPFFDSIQNNLLKGYKLHDDDIQLISSPEYFGLTHGDINPSNYFMNANLEPFIFDFDQAQHAFFAYDVAQAINAVFMVELGGNAFNRKPVPNVSTFGFAKRFLAGYEEVLEDNFREVVRYNHRMKAEFPDEEERLLPVPLRQVDRKHLRRMLRLRLEQYMRFTRLALEEIDGDAEKKERLEFVRGFCEFVDSWTSKLAGLPADTDYAKMKKDEEEVTADEADSLPPPPSSVHEENSIVAEMMMREPGETVTVDDYGFEVGNLLDRLVNESIPNAIALEAYEPEEEEEAAPQTQKMCC